MYNICLVPGDGIGAEVVPATQRVLEATNLPINFTHADAGWAIFEKEGKSVPENTLEKMRAADATLAGAFTSPSKKVAGFYSAIRTMREELNLYANYRPAKSRPVEGSQDNIDMLMIRENTEGLYVAAERRYGDIAVADAVVSKAASERITHIALKEAQKRTKKLAIIHKANVLPVTSGLFLHTAQDVAKAYPDVDSYDVIVDAAAMHLVRRPETFDVMVTTNLFGDILSDLMAGLVGGLGLAPSANVGDEHAVFEPVHGSGPDIAGQGIANPTATVLSACMMLEHLGEHKTAQMIENSLNTLLSQGIVTPDLSGSETTDSFTDALIKELTQ